MARRLHSLSRCFVRNCWTRGEIPGCKFVTRPPLVALATRFTMQQTFASTATATARVTSPHASFVAIRCLSSSSSIGIGATTTEGGEESYSLAMEALGNALRAKQQHEERLMKDQFDAMERQRSRTRQREQQRSQKREDPRLARLRAQDGGDGVLKDRAAGVAVVRTIVKQSQANRDVQIDKWDAAQPKKDETRQQLDSEEHWQTVAKKHMEEAAFRYGHPLALVRLGNEAVERSKDEATSSEPIMERERCKEWIDDSPIDLTMILELSSSVDGNAHNNELQIAMYLYEEGGRRGSHEGWYNLGHLLWDGPDSQYHGSPAREKAMQAFYEAIKLGDADAMYFVAAQYLSHEEGDEESHGSLLTKTYDQYGPKLVDLMQSTNLASSPGDNQAELSFANEMQQHGYRLLCTAAGQGHGPALHHLSLLHYQHGNIEEYRNLLSKAAATGNPDALFLLGHSYYFGNDGLIQDFPKALENFLAAGENGNADALVSAGAMLHQGVVHNGITVVERNQQRAFDLYQQAGELGSVEGWRNVVSCYATGEGVPKCLDTAKHIANTMLKDDNT